MYRFPRWPVVGLGLVFVGLLAWGTWFYRVQEKRCDTKPKRRSRPSRS